MVTITSNQYFMSMEFQIKATVILIIILSSNITNRTVQAWNKDYERIKLSDVQVITLYDGRMTTGRRSSPVPQLKCVGGSCSSFTPQTVQCKNVGSDGLDAQWECKCEFPSDIRFGRISVSCEGYEYADDPYVLKGSCGLEYTIEKTGSTYYSSHLKHSYDSSGGMFFSGMSFVVILVAIAMFMCCLTRSSDPRDPNHRGNYHPHDGGPPPPPNPPPYGWKQPGGEDTRFRGGYTSPPPSAPPPPTYEDATGQPGTSSGRQRANANDGPGFWSGMGLGAAAGYLFSRPRTQHRRTGWFGGGGSHTTHHHYHNTGPSSSSWGSSSWGSSPGSSSSRGSTTTRTSYGGTTRR